MGGDPQEGSPIVPRARRPATRVAVLAVVGAVSGAEGAGAGDVCGGAGRGWERRAMPRAPAASGGGAWVGAARGAWGWRGRREDRPGAGSKTGGEDEGEAAAGVREGWIRQGEVRIDPGKQSTAQ